MKNYIKILLLNFLLILFSCNETKKNKETLSNKKVKDSIEYNNDVLEKEISLKHPSEFNDILIYTVQIGAFRKPKSILENKSDVKSIKENSLIKYLLGNFETYKEATKFKNSILTSYPDAFIVPINKGTRIDITEALKLSNEN